MSALVFQDSNGDPVEIAADAGLAINATNQANVDEALDQLRGLRRDNRRGLIRAGFLLTGLLRALGGKSALEKKLKPLGLGSSEINKLIAVSNTPELGNVEYDRSLPNDLETLYVLAGKARYIRRLAELSVLSPDLKGSYVRKMCSHLDAVDAVYVDRLYADQLKKAKWVFGSNADPKPAYQIPKETDAPSRKSVVVKGRRVLHISVDLDVMGVSSVSELNTELEKIVKKITPHKGVVVDKIFDEDKAQKWFEKSDGRVQVDVKKSADDANAIVDGIYKVIPAGDARAQAVRAVVKDALRGSRAHELLEEHPDHPLHKVIADLKLDENAKGETGQFYRKPKSKVPRGSVVDTVRLSMKLDAANKEIAALPPYDDPDTDVGVSPGA